MKIISRFIPEYQEDLFFSPVREKTHYIKLLVQSASLLLFDVVGPKPETQKHTNLSLHIDRMSRVFFFKEKKCFSIAFPFNVHESDGEVMDISTYSGTKITLQNLSSLTSILSNEKYFSSSSVLTFFSIEEGCELQDLMLLEEFIQFEPGYIRYDIDGDREKGKLHPLHHLDINYSSYATYKIGLNSQLADGYFVNILNVNTDCCFLID